MRRALLVATLTLLLILDISAVPFAVAVIDHARASGHGLSSGLFFVLVLTVLGWLTSVLLTRLRKPTA